MKRTGARAKPQFCKSNATLGISLTKNTVRKPCLTTTSPTLRVFSFKNSLAFPLTKYRTSKNSQILEHIAPIRTYIVPQKLPNNTPPSIANGTAGKKQISKKPQRKLKPRKKQRIMNLIPPKKMSVVIRWGRCG